MHAIRKKIFTLINKEITTHFIGRASDVEAPGPEIIKNPAPDNSSSIALRLRF